jgi:hypothetical protein
VGLNFEMSKTPCHPLEKYCSDLYWLAFLITADHDRSVRAVTSVLEAGGSQELASNRTRELLLEASLAAIEFDLRKSVFQTFWKQDLSELDPLLARFSLARPEPAELRRAMLNIDVFPRCALTVFEHMPMQKTALLLDAGEELVRTGQSMGTIGLTRNLAINRGWVYVPVSPPPYLRGQGAMMRAQVSR